MATKEHDEPASPNVNTEPLTVHDPDDTAKVNAPLPDPPLVVRDREAPYVPVIEVMVSGLCEIRAMVSGADTYVTAYRFAFAGFKTAVGVMV